MCLILRETLIQNYIHIYPGSYLDDSQQLIINRFPILRQL